MAVSLPRLTADDEDITREEWEAPYDAVAEFKKLKANCFTPTELKTMRLIMLPAERPAPPDHNAVVAKSNELIPALAKFSLSEIQLLTFCASFLDSRPASATAQRGRAITARVADLQSIFSMTTKDAYAIVKRKILDINKKPYEHTGEDGSLICDFWFTRVKYSPGKGEFTFMISPEIEPYLLGLTGNFTRWRLGNVYQFKAASTWKLYENLAQWRQAGRWAVELDELRLRLGVAGKYPLWNLFNQRLISPAVAEINEHSDLEIKYTKEKRGRKVVGLVFLIDKKVDPDIINQDPPEDDLEKLLLDHGINAKTAKDYAQTINASGKADIIISKMPQIAARAQKSTTPTAKYILGSIKQELAQMSIFEAPRKAPDHTEALECWTSKNQKKEVCPVRQKGVAGQRKKCQMCLDKIPVDTFGV